jgi:DNA-binding NtrC family response regulator
VTAHGSSTAERIILVAPTGADAHNLASVLSKAGVSSTACPNLSAAAIELELGCGALVLTEDALNFSGHHELVAALDRQPAWSDVPVVLIVTGSRTPGAVAEAVRLIGSRGNIALVERPLHAATLVSTVQAALRARRRQYEVKTLLRERDELLASLEQRVAERTAKLE